MRGPTHLRRSTVVIALAVLTSAAGVFIADRAAAQEGPKPKAAMGIDGVKTAPPVVVATEPRAGADDVDPGLTEIKVTFSKDMQNGNWAFAQLSKETFPQTKGKPKYLDDKRTCVLPVKLEPGKTYVIALNRPPYDSFTDGEGRKALQYLLVFETKK
jgi:RNA polymerase sigma-70 factor (ECF subfamily)